MMILLAWAVAGLIIGAIARLVVPGEQRMGCFLTMVLGIAGAVVGGAISWLFLGLPAEPFSLHCTGWLLSILGAVVVLAVSGFFRNRAA